MGTTLRIAAFVAGLAAVFALALGVGRWIGPLDVEVEAASHGDGATGEHGDAGVADHDDSPDAGHDESPAPATGLTATRQEHTLRLLDPRPEAGRGVPVRLRIDGPDGHPVTELETVHDKELHLIAVRRDLTGFQHVHPRLGANGTWRTELDLRPGAWRVYADFTPTGGNGLVLADDLLVGGDFAPAPTPGPRSSDDVDGYRVTLAQEGEPGTSGTVTLRVTRDGEPVTDLQPYLGAHGHLVALRAGDLGYLHVHPEDGPPGPEIRFATGFPTAGTYALFGQFKHEGRVRTAHFVVEVGGHDH